MKDGHLFFPNALVCLKKGEGISPQQLRVCVARGWAFPPDFFTPAWLFLLPPVTVLLCVNNNSYSWLTEHLILAVHFATNRAFERRKWGGRSIQGAAVGRLMGIGVGRNQRREVHVLSHLQKFSDWLISPIIKLSLWVFQMGESQGLECSLTGRNQMQHVLVMLCQLWITRDVWGVVLKIQMPSVVSSQLLLPWANLIICHCRTVAAVYFA